MSRPLRIEYPAALFHITSRGNERRNIFLDDTDREQFLDYLGEAVDRFGWILTAYVLMSNHFHLVLELTRESLSDGMKWLNAVHAQTFNRRHKRVGHLVQGRPDMRLIEKENYALQVLRYVVLNPVRAGIVERPEEYEWSSYRATIGAVPAPPWLAVDNVLALFAPEREQATAEYQKFIAAGIGGHSPWKDLVGQIYLGNETWIEKVRERLPPKLQPVDHARVQREPVQRTMVDVVRTVADEFGMETSLLRATHGGSGRMIAAWLGRHEANLTLNSIAAGLRIRSATHASRLIQRCDSALNGDNSLQQTVARCVTRLHDLWKSEKG